MTQYFQMCYAYTYLSRGTYKIHDLVERLIATKMEESIFPVAFKELIGNVHTSQVIKNLPHGKTPKLQYEQRLIH